MMELGALAARLGHWDAAKVALVAAVVLAALLLWALAAGRLLKPVIVSAKSGPTEAPRGFCAALVARIKAVLEVLDYLATRREWRYRQPWMLVLGEQGAGKSSLVASVSASWRQEPPLGAAELAAPNTAWSFFRHGALIDVNGKLTAPGASGEASGQWKKTLHALNALRPERPLDGILLCVCARTLIEAGAVERERMAGDVCRQLSQLQDAIEFMLPVYVVVTQCDAVAGFGPFWRSQAPARRSEMFGYSATAQDRSAQPADWANAAFEIMGGCLRQLQVEVAARNKPVADVDNFFLFPGHFMSLREPLGHWLEMVFRATAWQSGYLFRGVYFTGAVDAEGVPTAAARSDVWFVDALVSLKALREPSLARPTRGGIWSRNRLIRSVQVGGLALAAALFLVMGWASLQFSHQIASLVSSMHKLEKDTPAGTGGTVCPGRELVYPLLVEVASIDTRTTYLAVPASWVDGRVADRSARRIGDNTVGVVLVPALACHLEARARRLVASVRDIEPAGAGDLAARRESLRALVAEVLALEDNLARFQKLTTDADRLDDAEFLSTLFELGRYAFGADLPPQVRRPGNILRNALVSLSAGNGSGAPSDWKKLALPIDMRTRLAQQIEDQGRAVRQALADEVRQGGDLLDALSKGREPVLESTRKFATWLAWIRQAWLSTSAEQSPCGEIALSIRAGVETLQARYAYPKDLVGTLTQFDARQCHAPEMQVLADMRLAPYGPVFKGGPAGLELAPLVQDELVGLPALVTLGFMRLNATRAFACDRNLALWHANEVAEAAGYLREYENFARLQKLPPLPAGGRPLYDRLARLSLARAMNDAMLRAELPQSAPTMLVRLESTGDGDEDLARASSELAQALPSMQGVLKAYRDYGYGSGAATVPQCVRDFAAASLDRVSGLAAASRLYVPQAAAGGGDLFDLGALPVLKDYLGRQLARAQVLAGYAAPFVSVLQAGGGDSGPQSEAATTAAYWSNTITEINRYTQAKEPGGQVAAFDNYFIKQLAGLTYANCGKVLDVYQSPEPGDDLFSTLRAQLEWEVSLRCVDRRQAQALAVYQTLALRFNRELAGRYPFADPGARDASPIVVKAFFTDYDAQRAALKEAMNGLPVKDWDAQHRFVAQLDGVAAFFRGNLDAAAASEPIRLNASFYALPKASRGGEEIVSWQLSSGSASAGYPNRPTTLDWAYGQPLALNLTWAAGSVWRPLADVAQSDLGVQDGTVAVYSQTGAWALLRMIDAHRPAVPGTPGSLNPDQQTLEFTLPTTGPNGPDGKAARDTARLYVNLLLSGNDPKTQAAVALKYPPGFPRVAPE
jgi:type VI secretion system protein ImpL